MLRSTLARKLRFEQLESRELLDGTNYFVSTAGNDARDGLTPATAWRTVWRATHTGLLMPGDTINVLPGVYAYDGVNTLVDGTAAAPITVRADGGPVTIQGGVRSNAWTLYDAASNVYVLDVDSAGVIPLWTFCGYATTAYGYGAPTNIASSFQANLADPAGNYCFNSDPSSWSDLFNPPPQLANACFFYWTGNVTGGYSAGTTMYLHAPPGWTQQDVAANVFRIWSEITSRFQLNSGTAR